jgi:hypothetical protein
VTVRNITFWDLGSLGGEIRGCNSSVMAGKVSLKMITPLGLRRIARTLEEMNTTKIDYASEIIIAF